MATYDLNRSELNSLLAADHIDPSVRKAIINYLVDDGLLTGPHGTVVVQEGTYPPLDSNTEVLLLNSPNATVNTSTDPNLKVIVDVGDAHLKVTGSDNVLVATGAGVDLINMSGSSGNDVVIAEGANTIGGGHGNDHLWGDSGNYSTLRGGGDDDGWHGRSDNGTMWGDSGNYSTLWGGDGHDASHGHSGHHEDGHGDTTTIIAGTGNETLIGGSGNYLFEVGTHGNDSIVGGSGHNTVDIDDSRRDATITHQHGVTTVQLSNTGQTITMSGVQDIVFTDHHGKV